MPTTPRADQLRVLVASEHALVADTVQAALASRGHEVVRMPWSIAEPPPSVADVEAEVGLLLCDLERWSLIRVAAAVIERTPVPWVALTNAPRGAAWGALFAAGAVMVVSSEVRLDQVGDVLESAVRRGATAAPDEREELVACWHELQTRRREVTRRIGSLSPQEREVLRLLHEGHPVEDVADALGVTRAEVGRHVASVTDKLDVRTPHEAVEVFDASLDLVGTAGSAGD